jgi:hypothetical protein
MTITLCPHCQMRILPRPDGTCPSCNGLIAQTEAPPPSKSYGAVIKRAAKPAERKKAAAKTARPRPPAPPSARDIETLYQDYHQTAVEVRRESVRSFTPYLIGGIVLCVVSILLSFTTWDQVQGIDVAKISEPSTATWLLIWIGVILLLGSILLGAIKGGQWGKTLVRDIAQDRVGFPEFYKAFTRRVWPKEGMVSGPALEKFLKIVGKK